MKMPELHRLRLYFTGNFQSSDFAYVLYPFLRIFKLFGFAPINLRNGRIFSSKGMQLEWDGVAWLWTIVVLVIYIGGFILGAHHLDITDNWDKMHDSRVIAYFTSWAQVVMLFALGAFAIFTSWTNMDKMQLLCRLIYKIDRNLTRITNMEMDYKPLRRRLFWEFCAALLVPVFLSMVNCFIVRPATDFYVIATCYWFICFAPILLLTFKEFQFYNLLRILKSKFICVNEMLSSFADSPVVSAPRRIFKVESVQELPLNNVHEMDCRTKPSLEVLQQLFETYAHIAEAVDLLLHYFSWHLLLMTTASFCVITIQSYNLFALLVHSIELSFLQVTFVVAWILVQIFSICVKVNSCNTTAKTMSATGPLLHKIKMEGSEEPLCLLYQVLQLFSLEILQRRHIFTAAGFFDMDYKLITSIITAVTTYLVIIIQFHLTSEGHTHE